MGLANVGDHCPGGDIEGGEEVTGAVALIVVGSPGRGCRQHGQGRGGTVEGLDLGFFVNGEHCRGDRGAHVEPDQVADLFHQIGIGRDLKAVLSPGFEPKARQISRTGCG